MKKSALVWIYSSSLLSILLLALMYLMYQVAGASYIPFDLFELLLDINFLGLKNAILLSETQLSFATIGGLATFISLVLYVFLSVILFITLQTNRIKPGLTVIIVSASLFGFPSIVIGLSTNAAYQADFSPTLNVLWLSFLFLWWGMSLNWLYGKLRAYEKTQLHTSVKSETEATKRMTRRQFLGLLGIGTASAVAVSAGLVSRREARVSHLQSRINTSDFLPPTIRTKIYPSGIDFRYPETTYGRYDSASRPIGICFPGGGARAAAAAIGQVRGVMELGLLDKVGTISCISGGVVFGALLSYASEDIDLRTLLGPSLLPSKISLQNLAEAGPLFAGTPWTLMTNDKVLKTISEILETGEAESSDRIFTHLIRKVMLEPVGLGARNRFQALNADDVQQIIARNPGLKSENFYTARSDVPFLVAGATHVYPTGQNQVYRHFEYTPQYVGTPQRFVAEAPGGADFGGGYIQTFSFNSDHPGKPDENDVVTVNTPDPIFSIADVLGSSIAAPGFFFSQYGIPNILPGFKYWPVVSVGREDAVKQSFTDGATLENFGIIPLLRRQYSLILFFINTENPLGSVGSDFSGGMDHRIGRLFGVLPENLGRIGTLDQQIFETGLFAHLSEALLAEKENGRFPMMVGEYSIVQPNPFDIPPYPGDGKVTIVWFYNDLNLEWAENLPVEIKELLASEDPLNNMKDFPCLATLNQNKNRDGFGEVLSLTKEQMNLMAHMWSYTVTHDAADLLTTLASKF